MVFAFIELIFTFSKKSLIIFKPVGFPINDGSIIVISFLGLELNKIL